MSDHLKRDNHLLRTPTGHLSRSCGDSACWMIPKHCLTGVDHPNGVIACVSSLFVFSIAGPGDCWYVNSGFTTYSSVPVGRTPIASGTEYASCADCLSDPIQSTGSSCCLAIGDTAMMHYSYQNVDPAMCPSLVTSGTVSAIYTSSGWISTPPLLGGPIPNGSACGKRRWDWLLPAGGSIITAGNCCVSSTVEYLACGGRNSHGCRLSAELGRQIVATITFKRSTCAGGGSLGCLKKAVNCVTGGCP